MKKSIIIFSLILASIYVYSQDEQTEIVNSNTEFAIKLYQQVKEKNENLFFSPFSISTCMAMTYSGSVGTTQDEIKEVMLFSENNDTFHQAIGKIIAKTEKKGFTDDDIKILIANSLWAQKDYSFLESFIKAAEVNYLASVKNVDFTDENNRQAAVDEINKWVEEKTNKKITNLIQPDIITGMTRLVLVNALYLSSPWATAFQVAKTTKSSFYNNGKTEISVDMMNNALNLNYFENETLQIVEIPLYDKKASLIIILPLEKKGLKNLEKEFNAKNLGTWISKFEAKQVDVYLPKFTIEKYFDLSDILKNMGMKTAFSDDADFSGMTGKQDLKISKIVHKANIEITESGIEAAAATAVVMNRKMGTNSEIEKTFKANHPFIFLIKENSTSSVVFMGNLQNL